MSNYHSNGIKELSVQFIRKMIDLFISLNVTNKMQCYTIFFVTVNVYIV